jgi:nucleoside-diphosphate-sugar epimerase
VPLPAAGEEFDYAQAKRAAEDVVRETLGERAVIARAGLLLGPREGPGRLPWWLGRIARGGTVPVPGPENLDLQYADARDLAAWLLDAGFRGTPGVFNVVGPIAGTTMAEIVDLCRDITGAEARFRWIDPGVIETAGIEPWTELPMWLPPGDSHAAMHRGDVTALMRTGFAQRALRDTIADTWAWMNTDEGRLALAGKRFGLSDEQEEALLVGQA